MKQRRNVEETPTPCSAATAYEHAVCVFRWPVACAVLAAAVAAPAVFAAPEGRTPVPAVASERPAPAEAKLDVSRLADRLAPEMMDVQRIVVAQQNGFSVADIAGPPGEPLSIKVKLPPDNGELFRVLMFRGLPENFKLTNGISLEDAWAVSPAEASDVALVAPPDYTGEFSMEVLFIRGNDESRERQVVNVRIGPGDDGDVAATGETGASDAAAANKPDLAPELQKSMFERASKMMSAGDIAGARLILSYLAEQGMAGAAYAMGQSYDPGFLDDLYIRGGDPANVEMARTWYRKAAELGNDDAASRLSALE
ncbi:MAG: hypothetical protein ACLFPA_05840 [Dichotomicrobium sp.]